MRNYYKYKQLIVFEHVMSKIILGRANLWKKSLL